MFNLETALRDLDQGNRGRFSGKEMSGNAMCRQGWAEGKNLGPPLHG